MNQQTRLILVEGVPFTGKSTTSEYITTQLSLNGHSARWVSEGMMLQDYFPYVLAVLDRQQIVTETALQAEWRAFVEHVQAETTIFVVDSALSYAAVDPLMMADRPTAAIHAELRQIAELCAPLQPHVIHLTGNAEQLVPASIAERGEGWQKHIVEQAEATPYQQARGRTGVAGATSLQHDLQELLREVLAHEGWSTLTLDVSAPDRSTQPRAILDFLGLDEIAVERPVLDHALLQSYVGSYTTDDPERVNKLLSVRLENDMLALHASNQRYGPLVPLSTTRFHLQASPLDVEFVVEDGLVRSLTLLTSDGKTHSYRRA